MTDQPNLPSIIVVAEESVHALLSTSGIGWNTQHRVATVGQLWDDLSGQRLSAESVAIIFSDSIFAGEGELEAAIGSLAPHAQTFILTWDSDRTARVMTGVHAFYARPDINVDPSTCPTYALDPNDKHMLLETLRAVLGQDGAITFPAQYACDTAGALVPDTAEDVVWEPQPHEEILAEAPTQVVGPAGVRLAQEAADALSAPSPDTVVDPYATGGAHAAAGGHYAAPINQEPAPAHQPVAHTQAVTQPAPGAFQAGPPRPTSTEHLQQLAEHIPTKQITIAVTSSKGGSGKCLTGDTLLTDPVTGDPVRLDSLIHQHGPTAQGTVHTYDGRFITEAKVLDRINSGTKVTHTVRTAGGKSIRATANHPFLTENGWTALAEIKVGDRIGTATRVPFPTRPTVLGAPELDLLSVLTAARHSAHNQAARNQTAIDLAYTACDDLGINTDEVNLAQPTTYRVLATATPTGAQCRDPRTRNTGGLRNFLHAHGMVGLSPTVSAARALPTPVFRLDPDQLARFVAIWWQTQATHPYDLNLNSEDAALDLAHLLLRFGVRSTLSCENTPTPRGDYTHWRLTIPAESRGAFDAALGRTSRPDAQPASSDVSGAWDTAREVFYDEVVAITENGPEQVWDIEVDRTHNFLANDLIVHNSTTAMMLAATIAKASQKAFEEGKAERPLKVVLVDMDTRDGQVASLLGEYMPTALNIRTSPQWDEETVLRNLVRNENLGIDALLAPIRPRTADDVGPDFYRHVIRVLKTTHDVVIMDTSVNYLEPLISTVCLPEATQILFVTTLATTSVQGMARALREVTEPVETGGMGIKRSKIGVVMNQSITQVGMDRDQVMTASLKVGIAGSIPLATKDVLICTNYNRMHLLMQHELLGPAYYRLAEVCMRNVATLSPLIESQQPPAPQIQPSVVPQATPGHAPGQPPSHPNGQAHPAASAPGAHVGGHPVNGHLGEEPEPVGAAGERRRSLFRKN